MIRRTLRIPEDLYEKMKQQAKSRGISCSALILNILWEHFSGE